MENIRRQAHGLRRTIMIHMKRYRITSIIAKSFIALALTASMPAISSAQEYDNAPVEISKEKVRIDGQVCYSHIVTEKQTLFSICKAYGVSIDDIYKYNPLVKEKGLKKNSILIIPAVSAVTEKTEETAVAKPEQQSQKKAEVKSPKRKTHTAKWYEDLDGIAAKYGVSANAIMRANNLTSKKLTKRQKLIIPNPGEFPDEAIEETPVEIVTDTTAVADSLPQDSDEHFFDFLFPKKEVSMSLLMPLKATGSSSSRQNMDFYSGVLLAVYDMYNEGVSTELDVFDIADGKMPESRWSLMNSDIIIGPVAPGDLTLLFEAVPEAKAVVSPLDPRAESLVYDNREMIQAPTPHSAQYLDLVSWIKEELKPEDRVLFITEKGAKQTEAVLSMTAAIDSSGIEYKPLSYSILEGRNITETLAWLMTETATNRIYIASESEAFVNDVVRNLNVMIHQKYNVVLYAPSKIRSFETIEVENFHNASMHVSLGYYIDYKDPKVQAFLLKYRALFNTEPTQFAYQGYDLAKYFIGLCSKYGNRWMEKLDDERASMLQSTFDFTRTPYGGYINNGVQRIIYGNNWTVEKIK